MLKTAVIGCGKIADGHVEQLRASRRARIVAVCDTEPLMAEQLATRMAVPTYYSDAAQMLEIERPDVVHIATPPASHEALARLALSAGCHVFMEKPFAPTRAQTMAIIAAAEQAGRRISVNYLYNFETPALELGQLLDRNALGDIVHLDVRYGYNLAGDYGLAVLANPQHWVHGLPARLFHNVLDHVLAKVVPFLDDDFSLHVDTLRMRPDSGNAVLDAMDDELRFSIRSRLVTVSGLVSAHARPVAHSLSVLGSKDSVELDYAARTLVHHASQRQPSAAGRLFPAFVQARRMAGNGWRNLGRFRRHQFHYFQPMRVLLERFHDAILDGAPDPIPHAHIIRTAALIDGIAAAMQVRK